MIQGAIQWILIVRTQTSDLLPLINKYLLPRYFPVFLDDCDSFKIFLHHGKAESDRNQANQAFR